MSKLFLRSFSLNLQICKLGDINIKKNGSETEDTTVKKTHRVFQASMSIFTGVVDQVSNMIVELDIPGDGGTFIWKMQLEAERIYVPLGDRKKWPTIIISIHWNL